MKTIFAALAGTALLAFAGPASAQVQTLRPTNSAPMQQAPYQQAAMPTWMQDDGSSSDFPIHMPGDFGAADELNRAYGNGFPQPVMPKAQSPMPQPPLYGPQY